MNRIISIVLIVLFTLINHGCLQNDKAHINGFDPYEKSIVELQSAMQQGEVSAVELVDYYNKRINTFDRQGPELSAVLVLNPSAKEIARKLDQERMDGHVRSALHGIPVLIKDNIDTNDMPCTAGSMALASSTPNQDSPLVEKLREAGAIILGKTNLSEWANFRGKRSSSGWSAIGGQCKNPYDHTRTPCGSSSGSGVAVAANYAPLAIGTETNGSIICPSTTNGIVGIKPTVGLVSRTGVIPISSTQDTPGPMAKTVTDAALCLSIIAGRDSMDLHTLDHNINLDSITNYLTVDALQGKRLGIFSPPLNQHSAVDTLFSIACRMLEAQGATIVEMDQFYEESPAPYSFQVMLYEYKAGLNAYFSSLDSTKTNIRTVYDLIKFNKEHEEQEMSFYGQEYLEMAYQKSDLQSIDYQENLDKLKVLSQDNGIDHNMSKYGLDAIIAPSGSPAWKIDHINGDHFILGSSSPAAHAGYPNITVPMGFVDHLPVGISFFGPAWSEAKLIGFAYAYEQATLHRRPPNL